MSEIKLTNIPLMSVKKIVEEFGDAYAKIINSNVPINRFPSVMLWGPPGIGKSQAIKQLALKLSKKRAKELISLM